MTKKRYDIFLDDKIIGTTELEKADAPMDVVFGQIQFNNIISGYDFFKKYCLENNLVQQAQKVVPLNLSSSHKRLLLFVI